MGLSKNAKRVVQPALFVYGSLMSKKYWQKIVGSKGVADLKIGPAKLKGWRRWWNGHRPSYGGSVLNLKRAPNGEMWGGLVTGLSKDAWNRLDAQESSHLPRQRFIVETEEGERVPAYAYRQRRRGPERPERAPKPAYIAAVVAGARALGRLATHDVKAEVKRLREKEAKARVVKRAAATPRPTSRGTSSSRATSGRRGSTTRRPSGRRG